MLSDKEAISGQDKLDPSVTINEAVNRLAAAAAAAAMPRSFLITRRRPDPPGHGEVLLPAAGGHQAPPVSEPQPCTSCPSSPGSDAPAATASPPPPIPRPPLDFAALAHAHRGLFLATYFPHTFGSFWANVYPKLGQHRAEEQLQPAVPATVHVPKPQRLVPAPPLPPQPPRGLLHQPWDTPASVGNGSESADEFPCADCGKRYSTSSNLARHRQTHRSAGDKKARTCPHCSKVYVSMPAYSMHVRTHNQGCACPYCGKKFSRPWLLQGHIRTHTGEKPFACSKCSKSFADKSNLRAHVQTHSTEKPFVCARCGKAFALKSYLYKHEESSCMRAGGGGGRHAGGGPHAARSR